MKSYDISSIGVLVLKFNSLKMVENNIKTYEKYIRINLNTLVLNHFHSVKNFLFSSAKPRDYYGMLGTGLPMSIYTTKSPIDKSRFNVTQLKYFLHYLYQRFQCTDNYKCTSLKFNLFYIFIYSIIHLWP